MNAVEIELPQSCISDDFLKSNLFELFYHSNNIDCIIAHPYYLPKDFWQRISKDDEIIYLDLSFQERQERIKKRSEDLQVKENIFPYGWLLKEEQDFKIFRKGEQNHGRY